MSKVVAEADCFVVRHCDNQSCIFKMMFMGYMDVPRTEMEKRRNAEISRVAGKGFYPKWVVVGQGDKVKLSCPDFQEK